MMSEVARLMQQITMEYEATQRALHDPAYGTAKHQFITARMESLGRCQESLMQLVGTPEGVRLTVQALDQAQEP
jgi:hypothetical protein